MEQTKQKETLLINTISDCILINHLGIATDKTLFTSFENLCILLNVDFNSIDPTMYHQLELIIASVKINPKNCNTELVQCLAQHAEHLLPQIKQLVLNYN